MIKVLSLTYTSPSKPSIYKVFINDVFMVCHFYLCRLVLWHFLNGVTKIHVSCKVHLHKSKIKVRLKSTLP